MKAIVFVGVSLLSVIGFGAVDRPNVLSLVGTGYHESNWFSYCTAVHSDKDGILFDKVDKFLLSPRYPAALRKVALKLHVSTVDHPTRYVRLRPFVDGMEVGTNVIDCSVSVLTEAQRYEWVTFDFDEETAVTAFRICLDGSGTKGNWRVSDILVFYGAREEGETEILKECARELPPPNVWLDDFGLTELHVVGEAVADAVGYRFAVERLEGLPRTECVENFIAAPNITAEGWTLDSAGIKLSYYEGQTADTLTSTDARSLRLESAGKQQATAWLEVVSSLAPARITEVSFVSKVGTVNRSDRVTVLGRRNVTEPWQAIALTNLCAVTRRQYVTNAIPQEVDVRQVCFRFEAETDSFTTASLDTLRFVYGGDEKRYPVETEDSVSSPRCDLTELPTARYGVRAKALGGENFRDSSWSAEQTVDLSWAGLVMTAPTAVTLRTADGSLAITWNPVADAAHYLVMVQSVDDPETPVVRDLLVKTSSATVPVPFAGEYAVTVTAVSPCGKSTARSAVVQGDVTVPPLDEVRVEALDRQTIQAKWTRVALAEGYQIKLVQIEGAARTQEIVWESDGTNIILPSGWSCEEEWPHGKWTSSSRLGPSLTYTDCWLASGDCGEPVTRVVCQYKCGTTAAATVANTRFGVFVSDSSGVWSRVAQKSVSTTLAELTLSFAATQDVRCVRFVSESVSKLTGGDIDLGRVCLTYGEETPVEVESLRVEEGDMTFRNLDPAGRYRVQVAALPSEGEVCTSAMLDLSSEKFRLTGAIPISSLRGKTYEETFDVLTNVTADVEVRKSGLDYWQFFKGSGAVEKMLYTDGTNRTVGGVYAFGGAAGERQLGTVATSTAGCTVGLAFRNDKTMPQHVAALSFETVQRNFRARPASYVFEWLLTDGATGTDSEGNWQLAEIPMTAPYTSETQDGQDAFRQRCDVSAAFASVRIPVGHVLLVRWRHEKLSSGPMMAIDDVSIRFTSEGGLTVIVK